MGVFVRTTNDGEPWGSLNRVETFKETPQTV